MNFTSSTSRQFATSALPAAVRDVAPVAALVITVVLLEPLHRSGIDVT
jgi:hypothetical protein